MDKIIDQVSRYHVVNYLIPGLFFWLMIDKVLNLNLRDENIWVVIVIGYIAGMVISRIGSFCLDPILKKIKLLKYEPIENYIKAEKMDTKIQELLTDSNMYRTMSTACIVLIIGYIAELIVNSLIVSVPELLKWIICLIMLLIVFTMAYIQQTKKIRNRVISVVEKEN